MPPDRAMLILDFDGVLADTEPIHFACWQRAFADLLGISIEGDYHQIVGLTLHQIYGLWLAPAHDDEDTRRDLLRHKTALFYELAAGRLQPMPGSIDLLRRARAAGWYTAIASRAERIRLLRTLDLMAMPALFDVILAGHDLIDAAADRKVHARAAQVFGIDPAACVVVEDSATGVADATACGIGRVIGFAPAGDGAALRAAGAQEVVKHLDDIYLPSVVETHA